jgi:hypothetical protein
MDGFASTGESSFLGVRWLAVREHVENFFAGVQRQSIAILRDFENRLFLREWMNRSDGSFSVVQSLVQNKVALIQKVMAGIAPDLFSASDKTGSKETRVLAGGDQSPPRSKHPGGRCGKDFAGY